MEFQIYLPDDLILRMREYRAFLQFMANRYAQGHYRYSTPNYRKKYITRLKLELEAYEKTGNIEHLANIANYAGLEIQAPENKKQHFNAFAKSVTRGKLK